MQSDLGFDELAASALRVMARGEPLKSYVRAAPELYRVLLRAALRYIGGETLEACVRTVRLANAAGATASVDYMGENTCDARAAAETTEEFLRLCEAIGAHGLRSSVSLDLTHLGLLVDRDLCFENVQRVARAALEARTELMINMEGSERTTDILLMHEKLSASFENVGITVQAYLHRTPDDLRAVLRRPGRIRLVKGAYGEPESVALPRRGGAVDAAYRGYLTQVLSSGHACSIATHDESLLDYADELLRKDLSRVANVEFEMLHGVATDQLARVKARGHAVREYIPYGQEWHLYLCHRLAEHPPNVYRALADCVGLG